MVRYVIVKFKADPDNVSCVPLGIGVGFLTKRPTMCSMPSPQLCMTCGDCEVPQSHDFRAQISSDVERVSVCTFLPPPLAQHPLLLWVFGN